ncbi:DNA-3-methyladenine glycosylase family protein [Pseudochryseolinea flava]|uniref:DNA-3-methyladenine glycosylase II n=1 Tax=Pseudochryseolinea flava TaxID=2059302 RepID=A0A364Y6F8_9BACT|nr:DNA-3-methyladenine glycosylase [Pseudochryseolinea flava]RAW02641.1 DNA-3-methyladenine glycosylase [Pseudochryseolinea flava]
MKSFNIPTPQEFDFELCLDFLKRSPRELLHRCNEVTVRKLIRQGQDTILFELSGQRDKMKAKVLNVDATPETKQAVVRYVGEWFDLKTDLKPFYQLASDDKLLKDLVVKFYGYRIVGQPDLFESLAWAILGQQINLTFAYTLKQRFVEQFGEKLVMRDEDYYLFPKPEVVALLNDSHLLPLQFSRQKSKYVVILAEAFASGQVSKDQIKQLPFEEAKAALMKIKGIGNWTANYALMKTFHYPEAFPLEDAGVHNAIKNLKNMKVKPTLDQVRRAFKKYKGWEAYATLYLWKSL